MGKHYQFLFKEIYSHNLNSFSQNFWIQYQRGLLQFFKFIKTHDFLLLHFQRLLGVNFYIKYLSYYFYYCYHQDDLYFLHLIHLICYYYYYYLNLFCCKNYFEMDLLHFQNHFSVNHHFQIYAFLHYLILHVALRLNFQQKILCLNVSIYLILMHLQLNSFS